MIAPEGWEVIAPEAPVDEDGIRSWFSTGPRGVDQDQLRRQATRITDLLVDVRSHGGPVVVAGFSQGGALALALAMSHIGASRISRVEASGAGKSGPVVSARPVSDVAQSTRRRADAYISICGFFPEVDLPSHEYPGGVAGSQPAEVLVLNTSEDQDIPAFLGVDAAALLSASGIGTSAQVLPGAHEVSDSVASAAAEWLSRTLAPQLRYSLALPVDRVAAGEELVSAPAIQVLAAGYEKLGFHAAFVTDHPAPDDRWLAGGGHQALEPTVALGVAAGATSSLKLHTNVYVLPYRNPFIAAKALASVDVLSGGRLIAGVAAGYVRPEFAALGADFDTRGESFEHSLEMLPKIWSGQSVGGEGTGWKARGVTALPAPVSPPPLWVGGNSLAAMRRSIQLAQGWSPMPTPAGSGKGLKTTEITSLDELARRLGDAAAMIDRYERHEPLTICFVPFALGAYMADPATGLDALVAEAATLHGMGVDWLALNVPGNSRSEVLENASDLAEALGLRAPA